MKQQLDANCFFSYVDFQLNKNRDTINKKAKDGSTPLQLAAEGGFIEVAFTKVH
jgi:ankyrin repeat protein